ncbi:MAG: S53 family peptidase [archaeon]|nr:MAG: S53 family peptidase [archaeon]
MKKVSAIASFIFAFTLFLSPFAFAAGSSSSSTFYYKPLVTWTAATPDGTSPQGIPLCGSGGGKIVCYSPSFISKAYDFPSSLNGSGQTILIVDAYGSPTIAADLATFDAYFGLPAPPSFTVFCGNGGCPAFTPGDYKHDVIGWGVETSLDVEWAHAMAPQADIVLVVASSSSGNAINDAEAAAIALYPGSIISQSFGIPEPYVHNNNAQVMQAHLNYIAAAAANDTVLASAGDSGGSNGFGFTNALFPASDPYVTGVGGTMGNPYNATGTLSPCAANMTCTSGLSTYLGPCTNPRLALPNCTPVGYGGEQVWNEISFGAATGGAPSILFTSVPGYQSGLGLTSRTTPDVAYNAAIDGGVLVKASFLSAAGYFVVGGTSAGSPQWAAIFALVNQARAIASLGSIGFANPTLYGLTAGQKTNDFHDILLGNNMLGGVLPGFSAGAGYDKTTGWGTPVVANLTSDLS